MCETLSGRAFVVSGSFCPVPPTSETVTYDAPKMGGLSRRGPTTAAGIAAKLRPRKRRASTAKTLAQSLTAMRAQGAFGK